MNNKEIEILNRINKEKELIFSITSGRSGTLLLTNLFKIVDDDIISIHEGRSSEEDVREDHTSFCNALRFIINNRRLGLHYLLYEKFPNILEYNQYFYIETDHSISKGFIESFWGLGVFPKFIILKRHPSEVAFSFLKFGSIIGRHFESYKHNINPSDIGVLPFIGWEESHNYELCYWYAIECERQQIKYEELLKKMNQPIIKINMYDLRDLDKFRNLCNQLGLNSKFDENKFRKIISTNQNPRNNLLSEEEISKIDFKQLEKNVWDKIYFYEPFLKTDVLSYWKEGRC